MWQQIGRDYYNIDVLVSLERDVRMVMLNFFPLLSMFSLIKAIQIKDRSNKSRWDNSVFYLSAMFPVRDLWKFGGNKE